MDPAYPKRKSHFAHHFVRVLHKSCAAQSIGPAACYLLCVIAHTEDAARYAGPVEFWNSQLMETLGFKSPKQLDVVRNKSIYAGWLWYGRRGNKSVGQYFVMIPERFQGLSDSPIEPSILSAGGMNSGMNGSSNGLTFIPDSERIGDGTRNEFETESGKHPIPIPFPVPNPITRTSADHKPARAKRNVIAYTSEFEAFWEVYPRRHGRKNGKGNAAKAFTKQSAQDQLLIMQATTNYAEHCETKQQHAKDAERFLANDLWREWISNDEQPEPSKYPMLPNRRGM